VIGNDELQLSGDGASWEASDVAQKLSGMPAADAKKRADRIDSVPLRQIRLEGLAIFFCLFAFR